MSTTVAQLINRARFHSPTFLQEAQPNLVLLEFLSTRRRAYINELAEDLKDRFSESRKIADTIAGALVGVDANGSLFTETTSGDGFDVLTDDTSGVLYLGPTVIAQDPYTDGFPLPAGNIRLVDIYASTNQLVDLPVVVVPASDRGLRAGIGGSLMAILVGFRLIPLKNPTDAGSMWDQVTDVTMTWIDEPPRYTLTGDWESQTLSPLPDSFADLLEYDLAAFMAGRAIAGGDEAAGAILQVAMRWRDEARQILATKARLDHQHVRSRRTTRNR